MKEVEDEIIAEVKVPLSYMEEFYNLRLHLNLIIQRLEARLEETSRVE